MDKGRDLQGEPLRGLKVLVIGAGFGGLSCAIELQTRGASVTVLESSPDMSKPGDVIMMPPNATTIIKRWGQSLPELMKGAAQPSELVIADKLGKVLLRQQLELECNGSPSCYTSRGLSQRIMYDYAVSLGVKVIFGAPVTSVSEDNDSASAIAAGQTYRADLVIAADGVRSKARSLVLGIEDRAKRSGFAVYRSWFDLELLRQNLETKYIGESEKSLFQIWIAEDVHAILTTNPSIQRATFFITHKDDADIQEDWNLPGDPEAMLEIVKGWDPILTELIKQVPKECLIDYKLLWRDPVKKWVSDRGRIGLVGDAAHPHLSTSGTGGAQAIEDGATIGVLLEKAGKDRIPLALRAYEKLRFERTSLTQRMGFETRHVWHQTDWEEVSKNPEVLKFPQPVWLNGINAGDYATEKFDEVIAHLEEGAPFTSNNVPEGYVHEDWTVNQMLAYEGKKVEKDFYKTRNT